MPIKPKCPDLSRVRIEKRPGDDWVVDVLIASEDEVYPVTVFGARDEQEAVRDALSSFAPRSPNDMAVLGVTRLPGGRDQKPNGAAVLGGANTKVFVARDGAPL